MSYLIGDEESLVTLQETLAFIDSFELEDSLIQSSTRGDDETSRKNSLSAARALIGKPSKQKNKKRKRGNLSSSTRLQQRKRAELLYLRRRAQELEEYMEKLRAARHRCPRPRAVSSEANTQLDAIATHTQLKWMEAAEAQYQARLRSEEANQNLKTIVAYQIQVSKSLRDILLQQVSSQVR
ncbi:unnamed protein product [Phytophthora lilii]|uniref:Unnamed protein product n=1 Tax=Phytophthora lilii TaxID=2077276 RepID=A0A9W6YFB4_9STRA|nr:unnamed protein product [Phytophthora lilii]